ncbi:hypothetical protein [Albibacterium sp.]|uniref:hypothetical protein n=1 Tax=Albibacterium sp. TaxID=2952885 RepID=UPI002CE6D81B|nr:hypothetical protein [Albibacterium sp.]HUH17786.1 hypothetical protein [Albibacterium sp.]
MIKRILPVCFLLMVSFAQAQSPILKKNVTGVQIGLFELDAYHEIRIANKASLRTDVLLFPAIWGGELYDNQSGFALYPAFTLTPKYYYNINRRVKKDKNIKNNAANYLGLQIRYMPGWVFSNHKNMNLPDQINFIPTYGFRRNFLNNFNYEFKTGFGYGFGRSEIFGVDMNVSGPVFDLTFKVGYDF